MVLKIFGLVTTINYNLICLLETWTTKQLNLGMWQDQYNAQWIEASKGKTVGRLSGGILLFIKSSINSVILHRSYNSCFVRIAHEEINCIIGFSSGLISPFSTKIL